MMLASLEVCHSRPIAPTRRIGLGRRNLPVSPAPGFGGLLLAGIVARFSSEVSVDLREDVFALFETVERREPIFQPQVRHRFQDDLVGLSSSTQSLHNEGDCFFFDFEEDLGLPVQLVLGAVYALVSLPSDSQEKVFPLFRSAFLWERPVDDIFVRSLLSGKNMDFGLDHFEAWSDPVSWALGILEIDRSDELPSKRFVQRRFRSLLRSVHPDLGGVGDSAASTIDELTQAREILLSSL